MKQNRKINVAPRRQGLYDPDNERDACGVGLVVNIKGNKTHDIVENGLQVLEHMMHRGAEGADNKTGDGAGILVQIPHEFILLQGIPVPEKGHYGTGLVFLPRDKAGQTAALGIVKRNVQAEGLNLMHVRDVPVNDDVLGRAARDTEPVIKQIFVTGDPGASTLERKLYIVRKKIEKEWLESDLEQKEACYVVSLSTRTLVYKGMLSSVQLRYYFPDLVNPYFTSGLALVHSRFSTNTFPTWSLAQPFRLFFTACSSSSCMCRPICSGRLSATAFRALSSHSLLRFPFLSLPAVHFPKAAFLPVPAERAIRAFARGSYRGC